MRLWKSKLLMGAAVLGLAFSAGPAMADIVEDTADVTATIDTHSGITAADGVDMDFGDWLLGATTGDNITVTLDPTDNSLTAVEGTTSQAVELTGATAGVAGTVTVDLPAGADVVELQMERGAITNFTDTELVLDDITYTTATETGANALDEATPVVVTVVDGGTPETVSFGGTITANETPPDGTHTATFTVTFGY